MSQQQWPIRFYLFFFAPIDLCHRFGIEWDHHSEHITTAFHLFFLSLHCGWHCSAFCVCKQLVISWFSIEKWQLVWTPFAKISSQKHVSAVLSLWKQYKVKLFRGNGILFHSTHNMHECTPILWLKMYLIRTVASRYNTQSQPKKLPKIIIIKSELSHAYCSLKCQINWVKSYIL